MYYTVWYFTGKFYAVVRQISMLCIDSKDFVFCVSWMATNARDVFTAKRFTPLLTEINAVVNVIRCRLQHCVRSLILCNLQHYFPQSLEKEKDK